MKENEMKREKALCYAYPSSPNAEKYGYGKQGMWYVITVDPNHLQKRYHKFECGSPDKEKVVEAFKKIKLPVNRLHSHQLETI